MRERSLKGVNLGFRSRHSCHGFVLYLTRLLGVGGDSLADAIHHFTDCKPQKHRPHDLSPTPPSQCNTRFPMNPSYRITSSWQVPGAPQSTSRFGKTPLNPPLPPLGYGCITSQLNL